MEGTSEAKRAAAVAGVLKYLALRAGGGRVGREQAAAVSAPGASGAGPWALYGRQAIMNQRIRMQARRRA
jgi:hypothetical protein